MRNPRILTACLVVSILIILSACGAQPAEVAPTTVPAATPADAPSAQPAAVQPTLAPTATMGTTGGMDHGGSGVMGTTTSDAPFDVRFIDSMIAHHEGAVIMAKQAQQQAEHPEITQLAAAIISAQEAEISQMQQWRSAWYPDLAPTAGMEMDMGPMAVPAGDTPFDQRFLEAMIPHHEGAIMMAKNALQEAEHPEIKMLAEAIVTAQEAEITQMKQWLMEWYGMAH